MKIRTRLLLLIITTVSITLTIITVLMYRNTVRTIEEQALYSIEENVQKTCAVLDTRLSVIKEATEKLNLDTRLYQLFVSMDETDSLSLLRASQEISGILRDYIPWYTDIYSAHLVTSYYRFGDDSHNYYPDFATSEIAKEAEKANGRLIWFPTYSYTEMYHITKLTDEQIPYGKLFTAVRQMNISDVSSGKVRRLGEIRENPCLVINFRPVYMKDILEKSSTNDSLKDMDYYVMDKDGTIVYSTETDMTEGSVYAADWLSARDEKTGFDGFFIWENEEKQLMSYCQSEVTGWLIVNTIPLSSLTGSITTRYLRYLVISFLILLGISALVSWFVSSAVNRQFYRVIGTIEQIGSGCFSGKIDYDQQDEFAFFYSKLEKMSSDLQNLIHENYEVKLIQRDTQIKALNAQLNPHFIYNTLNIINWTCLEGDTETTSQMLVNLSRMLRYTAYHTEPFELLKDDLEWLERYLFIMQFRFSERFEVLIDIPETLMNCKVPKLFLQPFVENSIVHGFENKKEKGLLEIHTEEDGKDIIFYVEDNGCGMSPEKVDEIMNGNPDSIGMANVKQRIQILYGPLYGVECYSQPGEGTCVMVKLPRMDL